ncbi:MAG: FG-GAP-like repeat-containing protein, partial [Thermoflexales bacterium]|nr:FG-GAP-like repeat-containing protein [Thermoflexales bacterium]
MNDQNLTTTLSVGVARPARRPGLRVATAAALMATSVLTGTLTSVGAPKVAQALTGTWTQTEWTTPNTTLSVQPSGTNQFFRPTSAGFGVLTGTFGVCAGSGPWCQGPSDGASGQTLRLAGNWKTDGGNLYSSDLNADGVSELLFANWWNNVNSHVFNGGWIYWGQGTGSSPSWTTTASTTLPTIGAMGVTVADLNGDGLPEVIFANYYDGSTGNLNSRIYWGQAGGTYGVTYSASAVTDIPTLGAAGTAVADLNADGRLEIVVANHTSAITFNVDSRIYWGQAGGTYGITYSASASTDLPTKGAAGIGVADLNGDRRPELVFANLAGNSRIYWGQSGGIYGTTYSVSAITDLPTSGSYGVAVGDLNVDSRPDVVFVSRVYWGQVGGTYGVAYSSALSTSLPSGTSHKVSVADVNNDGNLDIAAQDYDGGSTRFFLGPLPISGSATLSWTLPITFGFRGLSLSDLNSDGRVDLLTSRMGTPSPFYFSGGTSGRVYLHTGNNAAPYNTTPSFDLPASSSPAAYASFGSGRGTNGDWFSQPRPVYGTAFPVFGVLESQVMDSGLNGSAWTQVAATTQISAGTGITLFVAAGDNLAALSNPTWVQVGSMSNGSWSQSLTGVTGRYARYRVVLWRDATTEASPALQDITFTYETVPQQGTFNKSAPSNGAPGQPVNGLTLSWTTQGDATGYQVCYDTSLNGTCNGTWQSVGNTGSTVLNGLTPGTPYEWQVRACNLAGCNGGADGGAWWTFTTASGPAAFNKLTPPPGSSGHSVPINLTWQSTTGSGAVTYSYCVKTVNAPCTAGEWVNVGSSTSSGLLTLSPGTIYYWQARACDSVGCTEANGGSLWSFQTAATVGGFNKFAPGNAAINVNTTTAQLQWATAGGATDYRLCLGTAINACNIVGGGPGQYHSLGNTYFRILSDLPLQPNTTYYWQVLATNGVYTTFANGSPLAF